MDGFREVKWGLGGGRPLEILTWLHWLLVETLDLDEQLWVYWEPSLLGRQPRLAEGYHLQVDKMLGEGLKQVKSHRPGKSVGKARPGG